MSHYDEMTLALLALGESGVTDDTEAHLVTCERCRHEVEILSGVVATGRSIEPDDHPLSPSAAVWSRIVAEIEEDGAPGSVPVGTGDVIPLPIRRERPAQRRWVLPAAAAAVGLLVGVGGTYTLTRPDAPGSSSTPAATVTVAALEPLDDPGASGTAVLRVVTPQSRALTVTVAHLASHPGTFYEVWLMDPTNAKLVALGVLAPDGQGAYVVPAGLDLAEYSAVDVSLQQMNGSPEHSSISSVRGTFPA